MTTLLLACVLFFATHIGISGTPLRNALRSGIGANGYLGLYSIVAAGTLGFAIYAFSQADKLQFLWVPGPAARGVTYLLMVVSLIFLVGGFLVANPTQVGQEKKLAQAPRGVIQITRHPIQWAFILWAVGHIVGNGDVAGLIFFSTIGLVAILGTISMDKRKAQEDGFESFAAATSNVPFAAIVAGRASVNPRQWLLPIGVGLVAWFAVARLHAYFTGVAVM